MDMIGMARLGRDAEIRRLNDGTAVANLSLVFNYGKKDDEGKQASQWVDASIWGKMAEALAPYLTKGSQHYFHLEEPHQEEWEGRESSGVKIVARVLKVTLGPRQSSGEGGQRAPSPAPAPRAAAPRAPAPAPKPAQGFDDMDDDIPF